MAIIRLPQTKGEIEAAAAEIVHSARFDRWSTDASGIHFGTSRVAEEDVDDEALKSKLIESWLQRSSRLGAMEKKALITNIEMTLSPWSEDIRKLGPKRVVMILARRHWRGALDAKDFQTAHAL